MPYNVQRLMASLLMTRMPVDNGIMRQEAVVLAIKVDGKVLLRFHPQNLELKEIFVQETYMVEMLLDYDIDLSQVRQALKGAKYLELGLEIMTKALVTSDGAEMTLIPETE